MNDNSNMPEFDDVGDYSEWRLKVVLNSMPIPASWARISDMRIIFTNRKFTETYGYSLDDLTTIPEWIEMAYPNAEDREKTMNLWLPHLQECVSYPVEIEPVEIDIQCKDGSIKTALVAGVIMPQAEWALATFVDITDRKRDERLIRRLAEQDSLTQLPNRRSFDAYFERAVADAERDQGIMHLLMLDLDDFKEANDTFGHETGDHVLREAAQRFTSCVRASDIVARFGGDEFAIILNKSGNDENVMAICDKILHAIEKPFAIGSHTMHVSVSIGIGRFPADGNTTHELFKTADKALYRAKEEGRGRWKFYL